MNPRAIFSILLAVVLSGSTAVNAVQAQPGIPSPGAAPSSPQEPAEGALTPPRLSYADGQVSFWRPGAPEWTAAQINTPLAANDELYTGANGTMELQVGARAFVRAWTNTQLGLQNMEPDFLQLKVTVGHASLDLRSLESGRTVELDTPHAAFTIERAGYYRVDVTPDQTQLITRRGGAATMSVPGAQPATIAPSEEVVIEGTTAARVQAYVAPDLDSWDRWNYARTDQLLDSVSSRYVSSGVYGVDDLDHYGTWRVVQTYGTVWVPRGVAADWAPYSTGSWVWDPFYGWTWVDTAPWGWAPYHYGRWVFVDGFWGWAPGPAIARPVYAPALVVFLGGSPGIRVAAGPVLGWCALGWGEPVVPWWGRPGFVGLPWWGGWGGPRVVNNVVVNRTTVVNVQQITVYRNATVHNAVVAVDRNNFGRRPVMQARATAVDVQALRPVHGPLQVRPEPVSLVARVEPSLRPPQEVLVKPVVATRAPQRNRAASLAPEAGAPGVPSAATTAPAPRLVSPPPRGVNQPVESRPPFGQSPLERQRASQPPRAGDLQAPTPGPTPERPQPRPDGPAPRIQRQTPGEARPEPGRPPERGAAPVPPQAPAPPQGTRPGQREARPEPARPETGPTPAPPAPAQPQARPPQRETKPEAQPAPAPPQVRPPQREARPEPQSAPAPPPQVRPQRETKPEPQPAPAPPPQVRPQREARPEPQPAPAPPPQVRPQREARPEPQPAPAPPPQVRPQRETKPEPQPAPAPPPQVRPQREARPEPQPAPAPPAQPARPQREAKPEAPRPEARPAPPAAAAPQPPRPAPAEARPEAARPAPPQRAPQPREAPPQPQPPLPGEPANRLFPGRSEKKAPGAQANAHMGAPAAQGKAPAGAAGAQPRERERAHN
jgi:hypothetical protein